MAEKKQEKKPKKKHLAEIRTVAAHDGTYVHHHTYKNKPDDPHSEPERQNVATSQNADEAGQHVADAMAMNEQPEGQGQQEGGVEPDSGGGEAPATGAGEGIQ